MTGSGRSPQAKDHLSFKGHLQITPPWEPALVGGLSGNIQD